LGTVVAACAWHSESTAKTTIALDTGFSASVFDFISRLLSAATNKEAASGHTIPRTGGGFLKSLPQAAKTTTTGQKCQTPFEIDRGSQIVITSADLSGRD
jgi:hypothetical protein